MNLKYMDMHCDTITTLYNRVKENQDSGQNLKRNNLQLDIERMAKAGYLLQNFAVFLNQRKCSNLYEEAMKRIQFFKEQLFLYKKELVQVTSYEEILENEKKGVMSALLTLEGGEILEGNVDNLYEFYKQGVRMITLTWNYENELGHPNFDMNKYLQSGAAKPDLTGRDTENGLTDFGIEVVREMERLHMLVDVSHGSDQLFWDVIHYGKEPFVASHSNAKTIHNCSRNLTDEMIMALANRGGVMGMNFCADFVSDRCGREQMTYAEDMVRHMVHIKKIAGTDCIGLGSDYDGIDNQLEWKDAGGMEILYHEMREQGFTERECDRILGENVLRIYEERL